MNKQDNLCMDIAVRAAKDSKCPRNKVGCCVLLESGVLAIGYNGFPAGQVEQWTDGVESNPLVTHAELNALGKLLEQGVSAKNSTVYITLSPCLECSKLLVRAKVKKVVYLEAYRNRDGIEYLQTYGVEVKMFNGYVPDSGYHAGTPYTPYSTGGISAVPAYGGKAYARDSGDCSQRSCC